MSHIDDIDGVRRATLDRIERTERNYKAAFFGAAVLEALFLAAYLFLADIKSDRTHLLLLLSTVAGYSIVAIGLVALGLHVNRNTLRVLKSIEMLESRLTNDKS